jgi:hypothetical protein
MKVVLEFPKPKGDMEGAIPESERKRVGGGVVKGGVCRRGSRRE